MTIYAKSPGLVEQTVDGEIVVLDKKSGLIHQLNSTASDIWQCLQNNSTLQELTAYVSARYDADVAQIKSDIESTLRVMQRNQLIVTEQTE